MSRLDIENIYKKWWVGKLVRPTNSDFEFKRVVDLKFYSCPSGMVGSVELKFSNGSEELIIPSDVMAFRPRKKDLEVKEE